MFNPKNLIVSSAQDALRAWNDGGLIARIAMRTDVDVSMVNRPHKL
jgi:hypothetical protein